MDNECICKVPSTDPECPKHGSWVGETIEEANDALIERAIALGRKQFAIELKSKILDIGQEPINRFNYEYFLITQEELVSEMIQEELSK